MNTNTSGRKEVRHLISLLGSAFVIAFLIVTGLVYFYGSPGTYLIKNILVSPKTLEEIAFNEYDISIKKNSPFVFEKIEFVKSEPNGKGWERFDVSLSAYKSFYSVLENERSLFQVTNEMIKPFETITPSSLNILIEKEDKNTSQAGKKRLFQQVQFLEGDIFRVELPNEIKSQEKDKNWAYFSHAGIYEKTLRLFTSKDS